MLFNKIVVKFRSGSLMKGKTFDFSPEKRFFHVELVSGELVKIDMENLKTLEIDMEDLKAAFFVKDFKGNKNHKNTYNDVITGSGKKVEVEFLDAETIIGYALNYSPDRYGFFIIPADLQSNNERVFVIRSATKRITLL
ncbi:MAG: hypothetical protein HY808_02110 [Nitrospirae bacterium]|nr:hypothetical protein [Nitrospirota bacterium]